MFSKLKFKQFCMHDFERNIDDRNLQQIFVYYQRQCLGSEPKLFHNNAKSTSEINNYIFECLNCAFNIAISLLNYRKDRLF